MDKELTKAEISLIGRLLAAISIDSFRKLLTKHIKEAFISTHKNTNVEFNLGHSKPDPEALDYLTERVFILSDKTSSKLEGDLRFQLIEGLKANESIDTITKRLGTIFNDMMPWQLERLGRTEVLNAQNAGRLSAYEKSDVVEYKMIVGAMDKRLCGLCRRMRGQIQLLSQPFKDKTTGESWMHPPFHPNGRCGIVPLTRLPDNVITISGQLYAADEKLGKIELPTIEISRILLKSQQKRKAWVVQWADGRAVTCFEDEVDADYYIETSKKKDAGWFAFRNKVYREVKSGWSVKKKGTKITFKTDGESRKTDKVEINAGSLNKREITVPGYTTKKGVKVSAHKRMIKNVTPKEVAPKHNLDKKTQELSDALYVVTASRKELEKVKERQGKIVAMNELVVQDSKDTYNDLQAEGADDRTLASAQRSIDECVKRLEETKDHSAKIIRNEEMEVKVDQRKYEKVLMVSQGKEENVMPSQPRTTSYMTKENVKEEVHLADMGAVGGINSHDTSVLVFNDDSHAIYKTSGRAEMLGEVAAYEVSKIIGWDVIPETVGGDFGRGEGSCQKWVEGGKTTAYYPSGDCDVLREDHIDDLAKIFVLDMVNGNDDRHAANSTVKGDQVYAVDNERVGQYGVGQNSYEALMGREGHKMLNWMRYVPIPDLREKVSERAKDHMKVALDKRAEIISHYVNSDVGAVVVENVERNFDYIERYLEDYS